MLLSYRVSENFKIVANFDCCRRAWYEKRAFALSISLKNSEKNYEAV